MKRKLTTRRGSESGKSAVLLSAVLGFLTGFAVFTLFVLHPSKPSIFVGLDTLERVWTE
jgi:hypothetical protein